MRHLFAVLLAALAVLSALPAAAGAPPTILISIDGFRPDYLGRGLTPVLSRLAGEGVQASMRPSFPSKTYPNHYALVTGLRPDRNGVVANTMRDPILGRFSMSDRASVQDRRWWDEAEPIWVTAERRGVRTAPIFWPGSEAAIGGTRPAFHLAFDGAVSSAMRAQQLLALLDLEPGERPHFLTLYFDVVDTAGHHYGPQSAQVNAAIGEVDAAIGDLVAGLAQRRIAVNLVIVSDHGMAAVAPERRIALEDIAPAGGFQTLEQGPLMTVYPDAGRQEEVARVLTAPHDHLQCWRKADIPARFRYGGNPRVAPIICLPEVGWTLRPRGYVPNNPEGGEHGYDPAASDMAAIFIAHGPAFRPAVRLPAFDNVDVYPLLARLIGVKPRRSDADANLARRALAPSR
jgi:predicted AlkP superfamily pyrophosphatase or phosphodiesterase